MWSSCSCRAVVRTGTRCPECHSLVSPGPTAAAALLGLTLSGCFGKSVPLYGAEITDYVEHTGVDTTEDSAPDTADSGGT